MGAILEEYLVGNGAVYSIRSVLCPYITRLGIYGEIEPDQKEVPEGRARWNLRGLRLYFTVDPDSRHITDIIHEFS